MTEEQVILVDKNDHVVGSKPRSLATAADIYRVSSVWITDEQGRVLLAQRSWNKKRNPGKWGPAVAGTHTVGDTYISNAIRETAEEIGVTLKESALTKEYAYLRESSNKNSRLWVHAFHAKIDSKTHLTIDPVEVEAVKWFSADELRAAIIQDPSQFLESVELYFKQFGC